MTNEEVKEAWKKLYSEIDKDNWLFVGTINPEMVVLAIKALEERTQGEWIPVSERLPEYSGLYLISVDDLVTVANFTGTYFMNRGGYVEVDAWQPLLKPYKPYKEGEQKC